MNDTYQAVYDVVSNRVSGCNVADVIERVAREVFDISWIKDRALEAVDIMARDMTEPHVLMRPRVYKDGNMWCALYGENLMEGVCGFGETPYKACQAFNNEWLYPSKESPMSKIEELADKWRERAGESGGNNIGAAFCECADELSQALAEENEACAIACDRAYIAGAKFAMACGYEDNEQAVHDAIQSRLAEIAKCKHAPGGSQ